MPTSTAAMVTNASSPGCRFEMVSGIVIGPRGLSSSGTSSDTSSSRSPGATFAHVRPSARAGIRFASTSIGR